ncbi:amino acid adenylation domain-containing protein [Micromonospora peucetia]|uniref:amino acid adenylation domain-containing protein n=1 Tax=Micromonospora peucetia TaxID=47871 RepID=UPI00331996A2
MTAASGPPHPTSLYGWFARSAALHPSATALEVGEHVVSYARLESIAGRLAAGLVEANGGRRPARVGLLAGRTLAAYAGYLAVTRLGATVVPLNPSFPAARNAAITRAAKLDLVLAQAGGAAAELPAPLLTVDDATLATGEPTAEGPLPAAVEPAPTELAYILFTSGSTGGPKGVPIRHRNVCAYLGHIIERLDLGPGCRVSQTFDLTFDVSVLDLFATFGSGATLVVPGRNDILTPVRFVQRRSLTHWFSVPSVISFAQRLRALPPDSMPTLRRSMFAGEPFTLQQARAWAAAAPASVVENGYGPTELTVTCTGYALPRDPDRWPAPPNGTVPIGTGFAGLEYLVLDEDGCPAGEGELCVRGAQRFPGYLDPADNAGRFLAHDGGTATAYDPATPLTDAHWYRTGDRVRVTADGFVHCGRLDHQVQIQGYRVELGEVEAVLREQPGVREAIVVARSGPGGEQVLDAAYTGAPQDRETLLAALRDRLPAYMVPTTLAAFDDFPLNANGKIDRRALAEVLAR